MRILCNRCKKQNVDFSFKDKWAHIEYSEKGFGKLGDYYLCPKCASDYHEFINNESVIGGEKMNCLMCSYYWMNEGTCLGLDRYDECPWGIFD